MNEPEDPVPPDPLREEVRRFDAHRGLWARARAVDASPRFPSEEFRALGEAGLIGLSVPAEFGGRGLPASRAARALFELALRGGTMYAKLSLQAEFTSVLARAGDERLRAEQYRPLLRGERLIGNQITEPSAGSDLAGLTTRARPVDGGFRLDGTKSQAAFAADAAEALVYARLDGDPDPRGLTAFLVPQDGPGRERSAEPDLGERWMRRGTVTYRDVYVPADRLVGAPGRALDHLRSELAHERALLAAVYLGSAWGTWVEAVRHAGERTTFGRRLADHEAVAFPLVEDWARLTAAWQLLERTLARVDAGTATEAESALVKWFAAEVALAAADHAIQAVGGAAYSEARPFAQRWRDLRSARLAHGTDEVMHIVGARALWPRPARGVGKG